MKNILIDEYEIHAVMQAGQHIPIIPASKQIVVLCFTLLSDIQVDLSVEHTRLIKLKTKVCAVFLSTPPAPARTSPCRPSSTLSSPGRTWLRVWGENFQTKPSLFLSHFSWEEIKVMCHPAPQWFYHNLAPSPTQIYSGLELFFVSQFTWSHCPVCQEKL